MPFEPIATQEEFDEHVKARTDMVKRAAKIKDAASMASPVVSFVAAGIMSRFRVVSSS